MKLSAIYLIKSEEIALTYFTVTVSIQTGFVLKQSESNINIAILHLIKHMPWYVSARCSCDKSGKMYPSIITPYIPGFENIPHYLGDR